MTQNQSTITDRVLGYIKSHPRATASQAAEALKVNKTSTASLLGQATVSGRIRRIELETTERKSKGCRFVYEVADETKPAWPSKAQKLAARAKPRRRASINDIIASQPQSNGINGHNRLVITSRDAKAMLDSLRAKEAQEFAATEPVTSPSVDASEAVAPPSEAPQAQRMVERARILVRAGAGDQLNGAEWDILAGATGKSKDELLSQWGADPAVQSRFTVSTPLKAEEPKVERVHLTQAAHLMKLLATALLNDLITQVNAGLEGYIADYAKQLVQVQQPSEIVAAQAKLPTPEELRQRIAQGAQEPKERLRSVLVMGLMPAQAGEIQKAFHDCFDLRFWWPEEGADLLKDKARRADVVVAHVRHLAHANTEMVKSVGKQFVPVKGGVAQMKEKLTELYAES